MSLVQVNRTVCVSVVLFDLSWRNHARAAGGFVQFPGFDDGFGAGFLLLLTLPNLRPLHRGQLVAVNPLVLVHIPFCDVPLDMVARDFRSRGSFGLSPSRHADAT